MLKKLNYLLSKRDKQYLLFLLGFSVIISLVETVGIGIIMPFISVASNFHLIQSKKYFRYFYDLFHFHSDVHFILAFGIGLVLFYISRSLINLSYYYYLNKFAQGRYHLIASRLFKNYMGMDYKNFTDKNSADLTKNIVNEANNLVNLISSFLLLASEIFVLILIYGMLIYVNWKMTLLLSIFLGVNVFLLKKFVSTKIKKAGQEREQFQLDFYKVMNSAFGNFKSIKLSGKANHILTKFDEASYGYAASNAKNQTLAQFPRLFLEMLGFSLVSIIIIYLVVKYQHNIVSSLPVLTVFVLGLYRLLPSVNRIFANYNQILFYSKSLHIIHGELVYLPENLGEQKIDLKQKITLKNINFSYVHDKPILKNINLTITKGEKIGFVGESGSGKSTLIDIIIGLYKPENGEILIDGKKLYEPNIKAWRKKIGYIPQSIYLSDGNIAENVTMEDEIDEFRVKEVLTQANILNFLERNHDGIYTKVGENGVKLSGGQKQRVAIARALYHNPEILVLDEATSALDNETESKIMNEVYKVGKNKTVLIVAHRLSTLDGCDRIVRFEDGEMR